jgi:chemotaxis protein methyltransferase CheR
MLEQLSELVGERMGLHFPRERWHDLERRIRSAAKEFGFKDSESCLQHLLSSSLSKSQIEILASHLTVGETYFFREKKSFKALEEHILPELIRSRGGKEKRLRIWSAGCCTGEEPYSIAILISRLLPDHVDWNVTILGTDINARFLRKASLGVYGQWSFRGCPQWVREEYFKKTKEDRFEIAPDIKKMVMFFHHNLAEDPYPSLLNKTNAMDVIFCRNVLMYFAPGQATKVIQGFYGCLTDGGWLIVSPSEASCVLFPQFTPVNYPGVIFFRKDSRESSTSGVSIRANAPPWTIPEEINVPLQSIPATSEIKPELCWPLDTVKAPARNAEIPEPPKADSATYEQALILYEQGRYSEAKERVIELISNNRADSEAMALLARAYANRGELSEALDCCRKAISADKLNPAYHYLLATVFQEQKQFEEASSSLRRALYIDQGFVPAHFALGNLSLQRRRFRESRKHFENALSLLGAYKPEDILPEAEGMTAGRLMEIIRATTHVEKSA